MYTYTAVAMVCGIFGVNDQCKYTVSGSTDTDTGSVVIPFQLGLLSYNVKQLLSLPTMSIVIHNYSH